MPKIRVVEVCKLPEGVARFQSTVPELKSKTDEAIAAGKLIQVPNWNTTVTANGFTTTTTVQVWNNKDEYEAFTNEIKEKYSFLKAEYYHTVCKGYVNGSGENNTHQITTVTEE